MKQIQQIFDNFSRKQKMQAQDKNKVDSAMKMLQRDPGKFDQIMLNSKSTGLAAIKKLYKITKSHELEESDKINKILRMKSQNSNYRLERSSTSAQKLTEKDIILLVLQQILLKQNFEVIFQAKSSPKSQLSLKLISNDFIYNFIEVSQEINIKDTKIPREKFHSSNSDDIEEIQEWYIQHIVHEYGLVDSDILDLSFDAKSKKQENIAIFNWETVEKALLQRKKSSFKTQKHHPVFSVLHLSADDFFQSQGNFKFSIKKDQLGAIFERGKWPYFQPNFGFRYGVNATMYDMSTGWLQDHTDKSWAVAFHPCGVKKEQQSILRRKISKKSDEYIDQKSVNTKQIIGVGTYLYCYAQEALKYSDEIEVKGRKYRLVFQCRVNPQKILVCPGKQDFWVVKDSNDIRLYGILLVDNQEMADMKSPHEIYKEQFTYGQFKGQIQNKWRFH